MGNKSLFLSFIFILFFIHGAFALSVNISMAPSFNTGDEVSFNYTMSSDTLVSGQYFIWVSCPSAPKPLANIINFTLQPNQPAIQSYVYLSNLSDAIDPQECNATIYVISPQGLLQQSPFYLNTNPSFNFRVLTCADAPCNVPSTVFALNDNVYLKYLSDFQGLSLQSSLTSPDGKIQTLVLPATISASQIGLYNISIIASKPGYKTISTQMQFNVISQEPHIGYTSLVIEKQQIQKNAADNLIRTILIVLGGVIALAVIVLIVVFHFLKRNKRIS
ncbi:MAG: hypothetical protein KGH55_00010 [Nanoarchaeota archaeon]|nr:hypothetical protein [Nanoarchaeota archaeon]